MSIPIDDRGLLLGDGLFETLLWLPDGPVMFDAHAERMIRGCEVLGLPAPEPDALLEAATRAAASIDAPRIAVRLTWTAGSGGRGLDRPAKVEPRLIASGAAAPKPEGAASLVTSTIRRNQGSPASRLKTLAYLDNVLARREARAAGADEALMLNTAGEVACAAVANLFWFEEGDLLTPALDCGVLDGIVRGEVLRVATSVGVKAREVHASRADLDRASGLFLTNSLTGIRAVASLDGRPVGPHPGFEALKAALAAQLSGI